MAGEEPDVRVPEGVEAIAPGAFAARRGAVFITVPESVSSIGEGAFAQCAGLKEIKFGAQVTSLGREPFAGCDSLESIIAPGMTPGSFGSRGEQVSAVIGFCRCPETYSGEVKAEYERWMEQNTAMLIEASVERNMPDAVRYFTARRLINSADFEAALEKAQRANAMEIVALLLDYRAVLPEGENIFDKFEL